MTGQRNRAAQHVNIFIGEQPQKDVFHVRRFERLIDGFALPLGEVINRLRGGRGEHRVRMQQVNDIRQHAGIVEISERFNHGVEDNRVFGDGHHEKRLKGAFVADFAQRFRRDALHPRIRMMQRANQHGNGFGAADIA